MAPTLPATLQIDAWDGADAATSPPGADAVKWGLRQQLEPVVRTLAAATPPDLRRWDDPDVGWGLVLRDDDALSDADRAKAVDAPEPIRALLAARGNAPVFRYRPDAGHGYLCRYFPDRPSQKVQISGAGARGIAPGRLPFYLLVYGTPIQIPWSLQYVLNLPCFTGRLDLTGVALERYVAALIKGWSDAACAPERPLTFASDHGPDDITWLMRRAIAQPFHDKVASDDQIGTNALLLAGGDATVSALMKGLAKNHPAVVVSTSHGMTGPLDRPETMGAQLGLLVDSTGAVLDVAALLAAWQPDGAIWYAHACCSAGSDARTRYEGLVDKDSSVARILAGVARLGPRVAPLPQALLGAEKPLRAFIGHVEPTFDWTLRDPDTGQVLTKTIVNALYGNLYRKPPQTVGLALDGLYEHVGELMTLYEQLLRDVNASVPGAELGAIRTHLTGLDRQAMVILGDPTAAPPSLP